MFAMDSPPIVQASPAGDQESEAEDESDVIEVVANRSGQALKIDRRTYGVRQNPNSAQKDAIQLIRGLPAVTVTPDDQIMLLGSPSLRIFVDGRPYPGDPIQYLRTLHGSDIDSVEIITNPSAQYSAEGTAGIINIVLRRRPDDGVSGNVNGEVTSSGRVRADWLVRSKRGKWTYELDGVARWGRNWQSTYRKHRTVRETPDGTPRINTESGGGPTELLGGHAGAKLIYEPDPKTSLSGKITGGASWDVQRNKAEFTGLTPDFESFSGGQRIRHTGPFVIAELAFDKKGAKEGETLKASGQLFVSPDLEQNNRSEYSDGAEISIRRKTELLFGNAQIDWEHPMGKGEILSTGASWNLNRTDQRYRFESLGVGGSLGPDFSDRFTASNSTIAAYGTFQKALGSWTVMPGIRLERNSRRISSPGLPDVSILRSDLFPTFHVVHPLSKALKLTMSYSRRIDRAPGDYLRPYPMVEGVFTIVQGNPDLEDQSIDAYEINLHYNRKKIDGGVILYNRETRNVWSSSYSVVDGVNFYTYVNSGRARDRGAQIDLSTPILDRVKLNASVNLFNRRIPVNAPGGRRDEEIFRYTTNTTVEYNGRDRGKIPGDVAQLQWMYSGPSRDFEFYRNSWSWLTLSYTHSFRRDLSVTGTISRSGRTGHRLLAPLVEEYYSERRPIEFKLKLLKTFGAAE